MEASSFAPARRLRTVRNFEQDVGVARGGERTPAGKIFAAQFPAHGGPQFRVVAEVLAKPPHGFVRGERL
jgi:hypothetical protein